MPTTLTALWDVKRPLISTIVLGLLLALATIAGAHAATTRIASVSSCGTLGDGDSGGNSVTVADDGRYVAFTSLADDLVLDDTNGIADIFVAYPRGGPVPRQDSRRPCPGLTARASVSSSGEQANGSPQVWRAQMSRDHRYVAFDSDADNLVPGDTNGLRDVFVRDLGNATTTRVSVDWQGGQADGVSNVTDISADGRYVVFHSESGILVPNDANGTVRDVFVRDTVAQTTTLVSLAADGGPGNGASLDGTISDDGRYAAFSSRATNLVPGDTNGVDDIFVRDLVAGTTTRMSVAFRGNQADGPSDTPQISADGRFVAFSSTAPNLVMGDTNGAADTFVRGLALSATVRASVSSSGEQAQGNQSTPQSWMDISSDGRYVAFESLARNLVSGDTNDKWDIFRHDLRNGETIRASVSSNGEQAANGNSRFPAISSDGRFVSFASFANNLVPDDSNHASDAFVRDFAPEPEANPK